MNYKTLLILLVLSYSCIDSLYAQLYSYTNSTSGSYSSIAANTTGAALVRVNGATAPGSACGSGFSSTGFSSTGSYTGNLQAVEADITANAGYQLSVTGFSVGLRRSGTGPSNARLAYSTDNGATWIDKGSNDAPNNSSCGNTSTAIWTTAVTVPNPSTLKFRVYAFGASGTSGTFQILNLTINGTVLTTDSIFSTPSSFGPFCDNINDTITVPFTVSGSLSGTYYVQLSDASGIFPNSATANIISTGGASSPLTAVIPAGTPWGNGYLVRVVKQSPVLYGSGDNGSNITINPSVTPSIAVSADHSAICAGDTINFHVDSIANGGLSPAIFWYRNQNIVSTDTTYSGSTFTDGDSIYAVLLSNVLCPTHDSTWSSQLRLSVYQPAFISVFDTLCPGSSVFFHGSAQIVSGMYLDTLNTIHGCDSVVMLILLVRSTKRDTLHTSICQGDVYTLNGRSLTIAGTYNDTVRCDSIVTVVLIYKTVFRTTLNESICQGSSYPFGGQALTIAGSYSDTVRCDSIVMLTLTYKNIQRTNIATSICPGSSYAFHGHMLTAAGTYSDTLRCDSIVTLALSIKALNIINRSTHICQGSSYNFYGHSLIGSGIYSDTLSCDSIVILTLTVTPLPTPAIVQYPSSSHDTLATAGQYSSYQWYMNGQIINGAVSNVYITGAASGYYTVLVTDINGCTDSAGAIHWVVTGIEDISSGSVRLYPNPTSGVLHIKNVDATAIVAVKITDMEGRVVFAQSNAYSFIDAIDLSSLMAGSYLLTVTDEHNNSRSRQITKERGF